MTLGILATKVGMTQIFSDDGVRVPVTVLRVEDNTVIQKKSAESDGYTALQIGYGKKNQKKVSKALKGHYAKAEQSEANRHLREFRVSDEQFEKYNVGDKLGLDIIMGSGSIDASGISKGKGFAGVMKRHNFSGFRATHGTHEYFRHGGSIGCRAKPGKVFKGKKMAGQMGNERVTVMNLNLVQCIEDDNLVLVRGAVPGGKGAVLELRVSSRTANHIPGLEARSQVASKNPMKASKAGR
jgi:large subunit ribosomal protein L3